MKKIALVMAVITALLCVCLVGCTTDDGKIDNSTTTTKPNTTNKPSEIVTKAENVVTDIGENVSESVSDIGSGIGEGIKDITG
jgi:hypothetical protein